MQTNWLLTALLTLPALAGLAQATKPIGAPASLPADLAQLLVNTGGMNGDARQLVGDFARQYGTGSSGKTSTGIGNGADGSRAEPIRIGGGNQNPALDNYVFGTPPPTNGRPPGPNGPAPAPPMGAVGMNMLYDPWPTLHYFANVTWFAAYDAYANLNKVFGPYPAGCYPKTAAEASKCVSDYEPQYKQKLRENAYVNAGYATRNPDGSVTFKNQTVQTIATNSSWSKKLNDVVTTAWLMYLKDNYRSLATIQNFNAIYQYVFDFPYVQLKDDRFKGTAIISSQVYRFNEAFFVLSVQKNGIQNLYEAGKMDPAYYSPAKKLSFMVLK